MRLSNKLGRVLALAVIMSLVLAAATFAYEPASFKADGPAEVQTDAPAELPKASHRLIVELESPPLAVWYKTNRAAQGVNGGMDLKSAAAQNYVSQLQAEQAAFVTAMQSVLRDASVSNYINELGDSVQNSYQVVLNGMAIDPGSADVRTATFALLKLPGVKAVHRDYAHEPTLYASLPLIEAESAWNNAAIGGIANAGDGIKFASMDGGIHKDAPMFDGTGYSYPAGYPAGGLGLTANNNGKIIASRAYFRDWDPPADGDDNPWPGENGTPHGVHTSSTATGNVVTATYAGANVGQISGVAPAAWAMSYRVFYYSVTGDGSFYNAEGIAALEDIVVDGADVLNNSWGGGPTSVGGEFDALDTALINVANAGTFISMSAGNAGPGTGTMDHPSDDYISVGASTTTGTFAAGRFNITAPEPISASLQNMNYGTGLFGAAIPVGEVITHAFVSAQSVDPANVAGCDPWTGTPFANNAAIISRGTCNFSQKVYHAEQAGAEFVVIYNNAGDEIINMSCGNYCGPGQINIPSIFVGQTDGEGVVAWHASYGNASVLELDTLAYQTGNTPDIIAGFSSRGPGVGNVLKPDIVAPGVNIMAQGYTPGATGEDRHLGYGQVGGTSMSAPHVAGAAALLRQIHPGWSNAYIKSALMTTAKYMDIYNDAAQTDPAQPLDMGAGRLDLTNAADPGVILDPPSLSFGLLLDGTEKTITVTVTSVATATETYDLSTLYTGNGFAITQTTVLTGFAVSPISMTLAPGASADFVVTFDSAAGLGIGDNQGYIVLDGDGHDAHMPAWARVYAPPEADILVIDSDFSYLLGYPDYRAYYTTALNELGLAYDVWHADIYYANPMTIPDLSNLLAYKVVICFTGDNYNPDGTFTVSTPLTELDMNRLTEYANSGGIVIAMGQDMSSVLADSVFDDFVLGGDYLQDSVTGNALPDLPIVPFANAPPGFESISLNVGGPQTYTGTATLAAGNVATLEIYLPLALNSVPAGGSSVAYAQNAASASGSARFTYDVSSNRLDYQIQIDVTAPLQITSVSIRRGAAGEVGSQAHSLLAASTLVTPSLTLDDSLILAQADEAALLAGELYLDVRSTAHPLGELRDQLNMFPVGDGAANQLYIDEIATLPYAPADFTEGYTPLFKYPGARNIQDGVVAMAHRDQPTLERPGISYLGRSIYTTFGLEGVNDGLGTTSRSGLLDSFLDWAMDEPTVTITDTSTYSDTSPVTLFAATVASNIAGTTGYTYRWDFGDGSAYADSYTSSVAGYQYATCGSYDVRVEATDSWGNRVIGELEVTVTRCDP